MKKWLKQLICAHKWQFVRRRISLGCVSERQAVEQRCLKCQAERVVVETANGVAYNYANPNSDKSN